MPSSHPLPSSCHWLSALGAVLDPRSAPRLVWLFVGAILARGRRTATSWVRAASLSREFRPCYTTVSAAGKRADRIAARLAHAVVKPLVAGAARLTFAVDDTPTERYGRHVQGVGVHRPRSCLRASASADVRHFRHSPPRRDGRRDAGTSDTRSATSRVDSGRGATGSPYPLKA
jgi:hypothetical protein